ncbi:MAG TPA: MBL fold metallo-hydrolase [Clostridia bacterium]|nr:MBL fold metallo-hydrolase [Clostridia bacterium]
MRVVTLVENTSSREDFQSKHGLSLYAETALHKLLFDLGPDDAYLANAGKLGVDVSDVDVAFVSHGHVDHGGGIETFLKVNDHAPVYVQKNAFADTGALVRGSYRFIGLDSKLEEHPQIAFADGAKELDAELLLFSDVEGQFVSQGNRVLIANFGKGFTKDDFRHEQYLVVREKGKNVLFSGCSHRGVANILKKAEEHCGKIDICIGGFHLYDPVSRRPEEDELIDALAEKLLESDAVFYTCHCTGYSVYERMKNILGGRIFYLSAGDEITI